LDFLRTEIARVPTHLAGVTGGECVTWTHAAADMD
jgi:hypothetical protein